MGEALLALVTRGQSVKSKDRVGPHVASASWRKLYTYKYQVETIISQAVMVLLSPSSSLSVWYSWIGGKTVSLFVAFCGAIFGCSWFRRQFEARKRKDEISELRRELDEVGTEVRKKDELLAARVREADERKQRLEEKERELKEAQGKCQALGAQLGRRNQELQRCEEELQQHEREHALTVELLQTRTQELRGAETYLTRADTLSGAEVIALVNTLNAEIYQTAALVAESFDYTARAEGIEGSAEDADGLKEACTSVTDAIGTDMMEMLKSLDHRENPAVVQVALQAAMAAISDWIVRTWNLDETEADNWFQEVYKELRDAGKRSRVTCLKLSYSRPRTEGQTISGRWRALTRKYLPHTEEHELAFLFIDAIVNTLLVSNVVQSHDSILKSVETRFTERVVIITKVAQKLRKAIGEEVTSCDLEAIFIHQDTAFSPAQMEDEFTEGFKEGRDQTEPVLCTTQLGLRKFERPGKEAIWEDTILLKAKIASRSGIVELAGSAENLP
ncbi:hypothetical protein C0992_004794 [Termitomyces sp. T32_za158]|nr:hypothetical protein C0992_004794 [Termitomyces sp. T32_za158]